ncbi:MAG: DUF2911 domain-containing protein [Bacteroidetes bacterium]|nr:DUF2911 domain-containing protein [Bacteroidota bacterium]
MRKLFQTKLLSLVALAFLVTSVAQAQPVGSKNIASPRDSVMGTVAGAHIKIWYGSPSVKGRKIFGSLEPWGEVYRAGANEATQFTTDKDLTIGGKKLPAGTYAFFVIPMENGTWTVIFNKTAKQWGAFKYDEKQDQLRTDVKVRKIPNQERLVYVLTKNGFAMKWADTEVPVMVK